jgi:hypothetical protein
MDAWGEDSQHEVSHMEHHPVETKSLGWLVKEDEVGVSIAMDTYSDSPDEVRNTAFIPRGMVRNIIYLHQPRQEPQANNASN